MEYEVQFSRITTAGKLPDRFLNCQSRTFPDLSKSYMGTIYSLVEIVSPWFSTAQVGQSILNTFYQNYYEGDSTSDLDNFEEALKKVNENLVKITQSGETNWIGNLNAILAIVIENKILLAQTGKAEAYIFRDGKTNHLTYGLAQSQVETHPAKTFSNITSGELKSHDKVLIANPELFNNLDLDVIREMVTLHSSQEAVLQLAKILKKKKVRAVNALIMDLMTLEEASKVAPTNLTDNVQLDRPIESALVYWEKFWHQILRPILIFSGKNLKKAGEKSAYLAKNLKKQYELKRGSMPQSLPEEESKNIDKFDREFLAPTVGDEGLLKDEKIEYSPELNVHYYEQAQRKQNKNLGDKAGLYLEKIIAFIMWIIVQIKEKKNRRYLMVGLAVFILVVIGFIINSKRHSQKNAMSLLEAQTLLKDAESAQKEGKQFVLSGSQDQAMASFVECITSSNKILSIDLVKSDAKAARASCLTELDRLTATTRFEKLEPIINGNKDLTKIYIVGGQAIMASSSEVFVANLSSNKLQKSVTIPRNNGDIQFGALANGHIYFYTSSQKVYDYTTDGGKLDQLSGANWETANTGSFYAGSLYLLDGITGQIYKHNSNQDSFGEGSAYLTGNIEAKNGASMAIDGSIFVLQSDGQVLKFQRQRKQEFSLHNIPAPYDKIEKAIKIYTDNDTTSLYILDAGQKRILEFDKNGSFIHQYALPEYLTNLTDFTVSNKAKKIWLIDNGNLYEISI